MTVLYCTVLHVIIHITLIQVPVLNLPFFYPFHQFSQLINNQKKLGCDTFPLIDQTFYPNYRDMVSGLCFYVHTLYIVSIPAVNSQLQNTSFSKTDKMSPLMIFRFRYLDFCVFISLTVYLRAVKCLGSLLSAKLF